MKKLIYDNAERERERERERAKGGFSFVNKFDAVPAGNAFTFPLPPRLADLLKSLEIVSLQFLTRSLGWPAFASTPDSKMKSFFPSLFG
jgi:hypothetical protein